MTKTPKLRLYRGRDGKWRWTLTAANGRKVAASGESFARKPRNLWARLYNVVKDAVEEVG